MTAQIAFRGHRAQKIFSSVITGVAKGDTVLEERRHLGAGWGPPLSGVGPTDFESGLRFRPWFLALMFSLMQLRCRSRRRRSKMCSTNIVPLVKDGSFMLKFQSRSNFIFKVLCIHVRRDNWTEIPGRRNLFSCHPPATRVLPCQTRAVHSSAFSDTARDRPQLCSVQSLGHKI